jgi:hypothetical protein
MALGILRACYVSWLLLGLEWNWCLRPDTSRTVPGSNPGGGEIFRIRPDRPWGTLSIMYNGYRLKLSGLGFIHPPSSSAEVKERVELSLYFRSWPSCFILGWSLSLPLRSLGEKDALFECYGYLKEHYRLMGCDTVASGRILSMFWRNMLSTI